MAGAAMICVGDVIDGKYLITDVLGEGAMGIVYLAMHQRLQRRVALKTMQSDAVSDQELLGRFEREARAASAIGHPNIVQIYDAGGEPIPYLVMEHLQGQSLGDLLASSKDNRISIEHAVQICQECLLGLAAAHSAGIIHRDLKPDNIFIAQGAAASSESNVESIKILDFGISKILEGAEVEPGSSGGATIAGSVMGTPYYMSPEQVSGRADIDHRTDLWSMACVLYECISGTHPFPGDNFNQIMAAVLGGRFTSLRDLCADVPLALSDVIDRSLSQDRDKRYSDAPALAIALRATMGGLADEGGGISAFDELAARAQQQDTGGAAPSEFDELAARVAERDTGVAAPKKEQAQWPLDPRTPPPDHRFAPPDAYEEGKKLEINRPVLEDKRAKRSPAPKRRQATSGQDRREQVYVTRDEPKSLVATFFKFLLLLGLGAGGLAGYRYYTLGYIMPRPPLVSATVVVETDLPSATFFLDGKQKKARQIVLVGKEEHRLTVKSEGYLLSRTTLTAQVTRPLRARVSTGHTMPKIDPELIGYAPVDTAAPPPLSLAQIHAGYEKLSSLSGCGARLVKALEESLSGETGVSEAPISFNLVDECGLTVEASVARAPMLGHLDPASTELVASLVTLNEVLRSKKASTAMSSKLRKRHRARLAKAFAAAKREEREWMVAMNREYVHWLAADAARIRKREGATMHSLLRNVAVASDAWLRAHLAKAEVADTLHRALVRANKKATKDAAAHTLAYKTSGGAMFLRAMSPLMAAQPGTESAFWHNQAITVFNDFVLPIAVTRSEPAQGTSGTSPDAGL